MLFFFFKSHSLKKQYRTYIHIWSPLSLYIHTEKYFALAILSIGASLVAQKVKTLPVMQETQVWSLSWEDPLKEGMITYSSILAWESHEQRSLVGYSPWGHKESDTTEWLTHFVLKFTTLRDSLFLYGIHYITLLIFNLGFTWSLHQTPPVFFAGEELFLYTVI